MGRIDCTDEQVRTAQVITVALWPTSPLVGAVARAVVACALWGLLCGFGPERPTSMGPASLGRADATVASGTHIEAFASNPACVKRGKGQAFELGYVRNPLTSSNNFYVASADASSPYGVAGGFSFAYESGKLAGVGDFTSTDLRVAFGVAARSDVASMSLGASARKMGLTLNPGAGSEETLGGWTGDAGLIIDLVGGVTVGATIRNVLDVDGVKASRRIAGAVAYGSTKLIVETTGSWSLNGDAAVYRAGLTIPVGDIVALRGGYVHDNFIGVSTPRQSVTLGGSILFDRARLDAGGEMNLADTSEVRFGVSIVYFVSHAM